MFFLFFQFRGTFVENYTRFWVGVQSVTVNGPQADPQQPPVIQPGFQVKMVIDLECSIAVFSVLIKICQHTLDIESDLVRRILLSNVG